MKRVFLSRKNALFTTLSTLAASSLIGCSIPFIGDGEVNDQDQKNSSTQTASYAEEGSNKQWLKSGSLVLSRPAPQITQEEAGVALGFAPMSQLFGADGSRSGNWLLLQSSTGEAVMMEGKTAKARVRAEGLDRLKPGRYQVVHKQKNPAWYATNEYFSRRDLPIPPEGHPSRYLRGALGDHVIFLDKDTPLHSAAHFSDDVGGVRVDERALEPLYNELDVGSVIEVR